MSEYPEALGSPVDSSRPMLVIDCAEVGKAKNDTALVSALADETGE